MPGTPTTLGFAKPTPGGDRNSWGALWNGNADLTDKLHRTGLIIGEIRMWPLASAPSISSGGTWLVCDGSPVSRTTYDDLYALLTTTYGAGDGSNTFNLPDLKARVPIGYNATTIADTDTSDTDNFPNDVRSARAVADVGGEEGHTLVASEVPTLQHTHTVDSYDIGDTDPRTHSGNTATKVQSRSTGASLTDPGHFHTLNNHSLTSGPTNGLWGDPDEKFDSVKFFGENVDTKTTGITFNDPQHDHDIPSLNHDHTLSLTMNTTDLGQDQVHNNLQPFLVVNFIIFAKYPS